MPKPKITKNKPKRNPRDRHTLTPGRWEHLGTIIGDWIWDQERFHELLIEFFGENGIKSEEALAIHADEVFRRIEEGFRTRK